MTQHKDEGRKGFCPTCEGSVNNCGHSKQNVYSVNLNDGSGMSMTKCYSCERGSNSVTVAAAPVSGEAEELAREIYYCPETEKEKERAERWIPVSERLPKHGQIVLIAVSPTSDMIVAMYQQGGKFVSQPGMWVYSATHWCPLLPLPSAPDTEKKA